MFRIPSADRRFSQPNNSDVNGNIFATRNIDFDEEGYIKLSAGTVSIYGEGDDANFNDLQATFHGSQVYFVGDNVFSENTISLEFSPTNVTTSDTDAPSPGPEEDGVYFNGTEVISDGSSVSYNNAGTWVDISGTTAGTDPGVLAVFPAQNSLLFGKGNVVQRFNTGWSLAQTLTLPSEYKVSSIDVNGNYAYIGTRHDENGEAMLFLWTGINTTNDGSYGVGTHEIPSVKAYGSTVACITSLGQLLQFNGSGFNVLANLPVYYTRSSWTNPPNDYSGVTNRGVVVDGDLIYIMVDNEIHDLDVNYLPHFPGGVWCFDPKVGLHHKYSPTSSTVLATDLIPDTNVNTTTNTITDATITVPETGTPVVTKFGSSAIGGVSSGTWYYTIKVSDTEFQLADTLEDALNGNEVDMTAASGFSEFFFIEQVDYGDIAPSNRGSILILNPDEYIEEQVGRVIFSAQPLNTSGARIWRLCALTPGIDNRGYLVTPKMFASNLEDTFNSVTLRYRPLKRTDEILVKYRDKERLGLPAVPKGRGTSNDQATWTSTTTFTTTDDRSSYDLSGVEEGDEIEIIAGSGAGHIAHVQSISQSGYSYTVELDEACDLVSSGNKMMFVATGFKRLDSIDHTFEQNWKTISLNTNSDWLQLKIELRGRQVTIEDLIVNNKSHRQEP